MAAADDPYIDGSDQGRGLCRKIVGSNLDERGWQVGGHEFVVGDCLMQYGPERVVTPGIGDL